jgi:hypothetical protein
MGCNHLALHKQQESTACNFLNHPTPKHPCQVWTKHGAAYIIALQIKHQLERPENTRIRLGFPYPIPESYRYSYLSFRILQSSGAMSRDF